MTIKKPSGKPGAHHIAANDAIVGVAGVGDVGLLHHLIFRYNSANIVCALVAVTAPPTTRTTSKLSILDPNNIRPRNRRNRRHARTIHSNPDS